MSAIAMSSGTTEFLVNAAVNARERFAAIVGLGNVAIMDDGHVSLPEMRILLRAMGSRATDMPVHVATGINVLRPYMGLLRAQGWGFTLVKTEPDAADKALCEAARDFARCGVTDVVVVGGGHAYVSLVAHARLHVISHAGHCHAPPRTPPYGPGGGLTLARTSRPTEVATRHKKDPP